MVQQTRNPGMVVKDAAESLREHIPARSVLIEAEHNSRVTLNEAGTDETMETTHRIVAHVPSEDTNEFERAVADIPDLGVAITSSDDNGRNGRERYKLGVEE